MPNDSTLLFPVERRARNLGWLNLLSRQRMKPGNCMIPLCKALMRFSPCRRSRIVGMEPVIGSWRGVDSVPGVLFVEEEVWVSEDDGKKPTLWHPWLLPVQRKLRVIQLWVRRRAALLATLKLPILAAHWKRRQK